MSTAPKNIPSEAPIKVAASAGDVEAPFVAQAEAFIDARTEPEWLSTYRSNLLDYFKANGFPHKRIEEWKYTDLRSKMRSELALVEEIDPSVTGVGGPFKELDPTRIVIVDGIYRPQLSSDLPQGLELLDLTKEEAPDWVIQHFGAQSRAVPKTMVGLSSALAGTVLAARVTEGVSLDKPIHFVVIATSSKSQHHTRLLTVLEKGAQATITEEHFGEGGTDYFSGQVHEISLGEGANLQHYKVQNEDESALHIASIYADIGAGANLESFYLNSGATTARNDVLATLSGEEANFTFGCGYMVGAKQHTDTTVLVDHAVPNCTSREVVRGVLAERAKGVFQGKIIVREDAQKSDGYQMSKALLLSDKAEVDAKPELEIYADDVKCSHGSTVGELDEDSIFYLRSRGIPLAQAKALLIEGFLDDAIDEITNESVKEPLKGVVARWLSDHHRFVEAAASE